MIARRPLAPVFLSIAKPAMAVRASGVNVRSHWSIASSLWYCGTSAFLGSVRMRTSIVLSRLWNGTNTGNLPTNSWKRYPRFYGLVSVKVIYRNSSNFGVLEKIERYLPVSFQNRSNPWLAPVARQRRALGFLPLLTARCPCFAELRLSCLGSQKSLRQIQGTIKKTPVIKTNCAKRNDLHFHYFCAAPTCLNRYRHRWPQKVCWWCQLVSSRLSAS